MPLYRITPGKEIRYCEHCEHPFVFKLALAKNGRESRNAGRFCSRECYHDAIKRATKRCARCGKEFRVPPCWSHRRFCSYECAGNAPKKETRACVVCGDSFVVTKNQKTICCSRPCSVKFRTGRRSRAMLDDGTPRFHYTTYEWRQARKACIERDGGACVRCGSTVRLAAHHIVPWEQTRDDSLENLMTLCDVCHPIVERSLCE